MTADTRNFSDRAIRKIPEATLGFWIIKVACTTLGETGGDWVSMSLNIGYLVGSAIFLALFIGFVLGQVKVKQFHPFLYWATIVATTMLGTTMADFADRSLGIGYPGGVAIIGTLLAASLAIWYAVQRTIAVQSIVTEKAEWFYWVTILLSQTLGTALGDWVAGSDRGGLGVGYAFSTLIFCTGLAVVATCYFWTRVSRTALFWIAFILTRPLGATVGDLLDKPIAAGGLQISRFSVSVTLLVFIAACILLLPRRDQVD
jgi:uncharacterized membrane-anchored protein